MADDFATALARFRADAIPASDSAKRMAHAISVDLAESGLHVEPVGRRSEISTALADAAVIVNKAASA